MSTKNGKLRTASWILLAFVGAVILFFSCASAYLAYSGADFPIGGEPVAEVAGSSEAEAALRGIRGTSAAYAAAFAIMVLSIVVGPYRQGTKWSWWTLAAGFAVLACFTSLRLPTLGIAGGVGAAVIPAVLVLVGLLLDVGRLRTSTDT